MFTRISIIVLSASVFFTLTLDNVFASFIDHPVHSDKWTDKYDRHFKKYSKRYFGPLFDWHWFKAQAIAESALSHDAESHVGARGLMQIMPFWLDELGRPDDNLFDINTNLRFGCTILNIYLDREKGDMRKALARYNGSVGQNWYPQRVYKALRKTWYPQ